MSPAGAVPGKAAWRCQARDGCCSPQQLCSAAAPGCAVPIGPSPVPPSAHPAEQMGAWEACLWAGQGRLCRNPQEERGQQVLKVGSQTLLGSALILPGCTPGAAPSCPFPGRSRGTDPMGEAAFPAPGSRLLSALPLAKAAPGLSSCPSCSPQAAAAAVGCLPERGSCLLGQPALVLPPEELFFQ